MADETTDPATASGLGTLFWQQPGLDTERSEDGATLTVRYAGDYDAVKRYADSFDPGDAHPSDRNLVLTGIRVERYEGPSGRLELVYSDNAPGGTDQDPAARVKRTDWSLSTTPADVPIWRYCGPSDQSARRYRLEPWSQEPDADLKKDHKWRGPDGETNELGARDILLADKMLLGYETVQRHFPTIRKVTALTKGKVVPDGALDHIGAPTGAPSYFTSRAAAWLKVDEQIDIAADSSQTLTEEWIGGESFDENFYGTTGRWEFGTI